MPPDLQRGSDTPIYKQISGHYAAEIRNGTREAGSKLPSQADIAAEWQVAPLTAQRVVADLVDTGLVETSRGGTFVRRLPQIHRRAASRYHAAAREQEQGRGAFDREIRGHGMTPRSDVEVNRVVPPPRVAEVLGVDPESASVVVRQRRMYADDVPVQLAPSYIPLDIAGGTVLEERDTGPGGMLSRLAEMGQAEVRMSESVRIRRASAEERKFLELVGDAPVIEIWHVGYTAEDRAVEVCVFTMPASAWVLDYEWQVD